MRQPVKPMIFLLVITAILIMSCDISSLVAPASLPATGPGAVNTIVAQTAAAAANQTAAVESALTGTAEAALTQTEAMLPDTPTATLTPYQTQTPSSTPTVTVTFIFVLSTPTETPGPSSGHNALWSCQITGQTPANNVHFAPGALFKTTWTVKNTSSVAWKPTDIDMVFAGGTNLASESAFDTPNYVPVDNSESLRISMQAPAKSGTYTSNWSLRSGKTYFCPMSVVIIVP